jgi:hypothetical protein
VLGVFRSQRLVRLFGRRFVQARVNRDCDHERRGVRERLAVVALQRSAAPLAVARHFE